MIVDKKSLYSFLMMLKIEALLAVRHGDMILFGIVMPVGIMMLIGAVGDAKTASENFAGVASIGICAAGLMGIPLTVASYRHEKILKRFKATPVSPLLLLISITALQTFFAWISGAGVYLTARFMFGVTIEGSLFRYPGAFLFVQFSVYSIGFLIAAIVPDVKKANMVCVLLYFPMLILSGTTVPYSILPAAVQRFSDFFPLTQGIKILQGAVSGADIETDISRFAILAGMAFAAYIVSLKTFRWE
ncbi:MAG: ABC transporter permease [Spirochaetes bacterium]|nr:ABC transporter permease [Spirochaetota bacterium]MBN2769474.1 ABC transporter permease [Spirochaetota bacterium]